MSNRLDDFFDKEFEAQVPSQHSSAPSEQTFGIAMGGNYNTTPAKPNKKITVLLICIALVLAIAFGVFMGILIGSGSQEEDILSSVLNTLRNDYYFDISDQEWETIVANGGTAMLQGVDRYGQLLSPQVAYDLINGVSSITTVDGLSYGFTFSYVGVSGIMMVSSTVSESNAFGRLYSGDVILSLKDIKSASGDTLLDGNGNAVDSLNLATANSEYATTVMLASHTVTLVVLRGDNVVEVTVSKGTIGSVNNTDNLEFVQYYFGEDNTNVSTNVEPGRATSTMIYKSLDKLPSNVGYIHLSQFALSTDSDASVEFQTAMDKFKDSGRQYLVVDVKGNPGGDVQIATNIAGMLATDSMLSQSQLSQYGMSSDDSMLTVTMRDKNDNIANRYDIVSTYSQYFDTTSTDKHIAIWTDANSASASELLTGVLLDYGTGVQMGTTTYGKGIAQTVEPLYQHSGKVVETDGKEGSFYWCLYYTYAKYYSPFGNNIHDKGYTPSSQYDNLLDYSSLVDAVDGYWN